jgi:hypothetical protein
MNYNTIEHKKLIGTLSLFQLNDIHIKCSLVF